MTRHAKLLLVTSQGAEVKIGINDLAGAGYCVDVVQNSADALTRIDQFEPDLIIVHGELVYSAGREICKQASTFHTAVLVLMDSSELVALEHAVDIGADDAAGVPISRDELLHRVAELLVNGPEDLRSC